MSQHLQDHPAITPLRVPMKVALRQAADLETSLLGYISAAQNDLQRVEFLDEEQRAEVHAILEAMRHDDESHAALMERLADEGDVHV